MKISKIISYLRPIKADRYVEVLDSSIPGESEKILKSHKRTIARFAKRNGISKIYFYDARRKYSDMEDDFASIENRLASQVAFTLKKSQDEFISSSVEYFENPDKKFLPNLLKSIKNIIDKSTAYDSAETTSVYHNIDV